MSRREQANEEFLAGLKSRTSRAIQQYFFSHGVCVGRSDVRKAMALPEHEQLRVVGAILRASQRIDQLADGHRFLVASVEGEDDARGL